jgi:N-acetylmuramoyl-L-alanine amidase
MDSAHSRVPLILRCVRLLVAAALLWAAPAARAACVLDGVEVSAREHEVGIAFALSKGDPPECRAIALADPPRLVIDLDGAAMTAPKHPPVAVNVAGIERVRVAQFESDPAVTRIVCDLTVAPDAIKWRAVAAPGAFGLRVGPSVNGSLDLPQVTASGDGVLVRLVGAGANAYSMGALDDPPRVYVDVMDSRVEMSAKQACHTGPLRAIRMARHDVEGGATMTRVTAELSHPCSRAVYRDGLDLVLALDAPAPDGVVAPLQPGDALKGLKIVVDPGHGGHDVGAPADPGPPARGPYEKEIVLDIGLRLARLLTAEGARVKMTRTDDHYVALKARSDLANDWGADAFISIHCNSTETPNSSHGTTVYYDHEHSAQFAALVQESLVAALETKDNGTRGANFSVIRRATMPGILVETAFINHQGDRALLTTPTFRERVARGILDGLKRFICESRSTGRAAAP